MYNSQLIYPYLFNLAGQNLCEVASTTAQIQDTVTFSWSKQLNQTQSILILNRLLVRVCTGLVEFLHHSSYRSQLQCWGRGHREIKILIIIGMYQWSRKMFDIGGGG